MVHTTHKDNKREINFEFSRVTHIDVYKPKGNKRLYQKIKTMPISFILYYKSTTSIMVD